MINPKAIQNVLAAATVTFSLLAPCAHAEFTLVDPAQSAPHVEAPYPAYAAPAQRPNTAPLQIELVRLRQELQTTKSQLAVAQADANHSRQDLLACRAEHEPPQATAHRVSVNFAFGHSAFNPASSEAESLVASAKAALRVVIIGHPDSLGSLTANRRVAKLRADAARSFLVERGVPAGKITIDGRVGEFIASNSTEVGRTANRRVVFDFVQ